MARARIPRAVLADELRQFVLSWRDGEVWYLPEGISGNLMHQFQGRLGPKYGEGDEWKAQVGSNQFLTEEERRDVYDVLWSYIEAGILRPLTGGHRDQTRDAWAELYFTPYGRSVLEGGAPIPEDINDYLTWLSANAPRLDQTARFYVEQALRAFRAKLYPATAVMLGCAAEHIVEKMAETLVPKLPSTAGTRLRASLEEGPLSNVWELFRKQFESYRKTVFKGMSRTSETALDGLFLVVKRARDDGGHPTEIHLTDSEARALLLSFLEYARYGSAALDGVAALPDV